MNKKKPLKEKSFLSKLKWLDPFYYVDLLIMPKVNELTNNNSIVEFLVNIFFAGVFAFAIYFLLGLLFQTSTPMVIVFSASMEPTFFRGDVMALKSYPGFDSVPEINIDRSLSNTPLSEFAKLNYSDLGVDSISFDGNKIVKIQKEGEVIVYPSYPYGLPIIHRAVVQLNAKDGIFFITKGDNTKTNKTVDQDCGRVMIQKSEKPCITFYPVPAEQIQGVSFAKIPLVGCVKLWLFDDLSSLITTGKLPKDFSGIC